MTHFFSASPVVQSRVFQVGQLGARVDIRSHTTSAGYVGIILQAKTNGSFLLCTSTKYGFKLQGKHLVLSLLRTKGIKALFSHFSQPKTGMLAGLGDAAAARGGDSLSDQFDVWLAGRLILNGTDPVNPLQWWIQQKASGNNHGGLVHMALDVLSCAGELTIYLIAKFIQLESLMIYFFSNVG
jgi:hypothetical protein